MVSNFTFPKLFDEENLVSLKEIEYHQTLLGPKVFNGGSPKPI